MLTTILADVAKGFAALAALVLAVIVVGWFIHRWADNVTAARHNPGCPAQPPAGAVYIDGKWRMEGDSYNWYPGDCTCPAVKP